MDFRPLVEWASIERTFLRAELRLLEEGGQILSAAGDDITETKASEIQRRIEHVNKLISDLHETKT